MPHPPLAHARFRRGWMRELAAVALVVAAVFAVYAGQPGMSLNDSLVMDSAHYHKMAEQMAAGEPVRAVEPFVYRLGTPFLAAALSPEDLVGGFGWVNRVFGFLSALLLYGLMRRFVARPLIAGALLVVYLTYMLGPARFYHFYPVFTDAGALFFCLLILHLSLTGEARYGPGRAVAVAALTFVGVWFREMVLIAAVAGLLASPAVRIAWPRLPAGLSWRPREAALRALPVAAGVAGLVWARALVTVAPSDYGFVSHALGGLAAHLQAPAGYVAAMVTGWGPMVLLLAVLAPRIDGRDIARHQVPLAFAAATVALSLLGGNHTERFLFWGVPGWLPLLGVALERYLAAGAGRWARVLLVLTPALAAQLLAQRAFALIPDITALQPPAARMTPEFTLFSPYGENISGLLVFPIGMPHRYETIIALQLGALLLWLLAAGFAVERCYSKKKNT